MGNGDERDLEADMRMVENRARSMVKHMMRIRHILEMRAAARVTTVWTAMAMASEIFPWCE